SLFPAGEGKSLVSPVFFSSGSALEGRAPGFQLALVQAKQNAQASSPPSSQLLGPRRRPHHPRVSRAL
ncbi:mCG1040340, partial [Mus musculus]